jgi:uncharacterized membrane protein
MPEDGSNSKSSHEKILLFLTGLGVFFVVAFHVSPLWDYSFLIWFELLMALMATVAFFNSALLLGVRNTLIFLALAAGTGYLAEQVGIWTGAIFGPYYYTEKLGFKIIDVPWVIPLCWFAVVYFAHVLTNLIAHAHPVAQENKFSHALVLAGITAFIATGFDVAIDPTMSHKEVAAWVWTEGGDYMGVPFKNYQGWVITSFLIDLAFRLLSLRISKRPISSRNRTAALYVIVAWSGMGAGYILIGMPVATQLIAVFTMSLPACIALASLYTRAWNTETVQNNIN